jgi:ATP-binding cassette subfamily B protein
MGISRAGEDEERPDKGSVMLAARYYRRELTRLWPLALPAVLGPTLGNIGLLYLAPLFVARLVTRISGNAHLAFGSVIPYAIGFTGGVLLFSEVFWRIGIHFLNRLDALGIEHLYVVGLDELFAKDAAFFHDNFAGSLTKRVLSFASRFEQTCGTLVVNSQGSCGWLSWSGRLGLCCGGRGWPGARAGTPSRSTPHKPTNGQRVTQRSPQNRILVRQVTATVRSAFRVRG